MKKIINKPENVVTEMLDGLAYVHSDLVHRVDGFDIIVRNEQAAGQVGLISGGGSGHEPAHAGFVGDGMLSAPTCLDEDRLVILARRQREGEKTASLREIVNMAVRQ